MTESIAARDAYARTVAARVTASDRLDDGTFAVTLDRTVFYPGGGGQPSDTGWLRPTSSGEDPEPRGWTVRGARRSGESIVHLVDPEDIPPAPGEGVAVEIDWTRRHLLMRTHTALHTLCGVVWRDYGAQVTGGNMEPGSGRMDFEFERMSGELVGEIERKVNEELTAERDVVVRFLPREEAFEIPDLIRTKVNLLPEGIRQVRVVEIVGLDVQADGGTHVANTREVGLVRVTGYESKGRINKRIRLEVIDTTAVGG